MKTQDDIDAFNKRNRVEDNLDFIESHPLVTRVEVSISFQDDGKTLKVFLGEQ